MAAIVLDHEQPHQKAGRRDDQYQAPPEAEMNCPPGQRPEGGERDGCDRQLEHAAARRRRAISDENFEPGFSSEPW